MSGSGVGENNSPPPLPWAPWALPPSFDSWEASHSGEKKNLEFHCCHSNDNWSGVGCVYKSPTFHLELVNKISTLQQETTFYNQLIIYPFSSPRPEKSYLPSQPIAAMSAKDQLKFKKDAMCVALVCEEDGGHSNNCHSSSSNSSNSNSSGRKWGQFGNRALALCIVLGVLFFLLVLICVGAMSLSIVALRKASTTEQQWPSKGWSDNSLFTEQQQQQGEEEEEEEEDDTLFQVNELLVVRQWQLVSNWPCNFYYNIQCIMATTELAAIERWPDYTDQCINRQVPLELYCNARMGGQAASL